MLEPRLFGEQVLLSGNLSNILYLLIFIAGIPGLRRNRWHLFYGAVIAASLVKPAFLAFLVLPLLAGEQQLWLSAASAFIVVAGYMGQRYAMPREYGAFKNAVFTEIFVREDFGIGIFSYFMMAGRRLHGFQPVEASIAHGVVVCTLLAGVLFAWRVRRDPPAARLWVPVLLVLAILPNPRMQTYDACIALLPATFLCVDALQEALRSRRGAIVIAAPLALFLVLLSRASLASPCVLLLGVVMVTVYRFYRKYPAAYPGLAGRVFVGSARGGGVLRPSDRYAAVPLRCRSMLSAGDAVIERDAEYWIEKLNLRPHPEGGFYRVTYTAGVEIAEEALPAKFHGPRPVSTAIYFLLSDTHRETGSGGHFSAFHRLRSDEMWHFYTGGPLAVHVIAPDGTNSKLLVGPDPEEGQVFQTVVQAGCWFASAPLLPKGYALVGCTVAPGFDFADFELARRAELTAVYPRHARLIEQFTRG